MIRNRIKNFIWAFMVVFLTEGFAWSGTVYSFEKIWNLTLLHSSEIAAAQHEAKAAQIGESRADSHWFPRVYLNARGYTTNDPAISFMSNLDQRQISAADFDPNSLNDPANHFYETGTLGVDLPLFEGGAKVGLAASAEKMREAKDWQLKAEVTDQYIELASRYASLLALEKERQSLAELSEKVQRTIDHYHIGARSNPVGYSGLLGLKNLRNRLEGLLNENNAEQSVLKEQVKVVAKDLPGDWKSTGESSEEFLKKVFAFSSADKAQEPAFVQAAQAQAETMKKLRSVETAKLLPRVGVYAEGYLTNGDRATATSYSSGVYLQWDLFSAPNWGADHQAGEEALAAQSKADQMAQRAVMEKTKAQETLQALHADLRLMEDSAQMLEEQTQTAIGLFKNGSINALQLVEVLSRRADLLTNHFEVEMGLVNTAASLAANSGSIQGDVHEIQ